MNYDWSMLNHISRLISGEENEAMEKLPNMKEVEKAVFYLSGGLGFRSLFV